MSSSFAVDGVSPPAPAAGELFIDRHDQSRAFKSMLNDFLSTTR